MRARLGYLLLIAARARTPLPPLAATLFALVGVFFYPHNEVGATWALTGLLCCGLAAWLTGAVLAGEPPAQAEIATAALGGQRGRLKLELLLVMLVALVLALLFVAYPLLLGLVQEHLFEPAPKLGDVAAAALGQFACGLVGGAVALLCAPPRLRRRATAVGATLLILLLLVPLADPLGAAGGPVAVARALNDAAPGTFPAQELLAAASCLALTVLAAALAARWTRRAA